METCTDQELLRDLLAWLKHNLATVVIHRSTGKGGHDGDGTSWSAVAIPEWSVRQKIDEIEQQVSQE